MATYHDGLMALGDPTRRALYERLRAGPTPVGELARHLPVTRSAVSQHLRVLSEAGLVSHRRVGTRNVYALEPSGLEPLRTYFEQAWEESLAQFKSVADSYQGEEKELVLPKVDFTIRKSVSVRLPVDRAFALFTERISSWWPFKTKSISEDRAESVLLEGWAGGRVFEQIAGGGQALWGQVVIWDPPHRLVISWHVNADKPATLIEVTFTQHDDGTTVALEHRGWESYGEQAASYSGNYSTGWDFIFLKCFKDAAAA